jgi:hypothetical protein
MFVHFLFRHRRAYLSAAPHRQAGSVQLQQRSAAPLPPPGGGFSQTREAGPGGPLKVTLHDCLACSGCVTSAEAVLLEQQSAGEVLAKLADRRTAVVFTLSPQSRAALAAAHGLGPAAAQARLAAFLKSLGAAAVLDAAAGRDLALLEAAAEFVQRFRAARGATPGAAGAGRAASGAAAGPSGRPGVVSVAAGQPRASSPGGAAAPCRAPGAEPCAAAAAWGDASVCGCDGARAGAAAAPGPGCAAANGWGGAHVGTAGAGAVGRPGQAADHTGGPPAPHAGGAPPGQPAGAREAHGAYANGAALAASAAARAAAAERPAATSGRAGAEPDGVLHGLSPSGALREAGCGGREGAGGGAHSGPLPMLASACPGWVCYAEKTHGEYALPHISTAKSPQARARRGLCSCAAGVAATWDHERLAAGLWRPPVHAGVRGLQVPQ